MHKSRHAGVTENFTVRLTLEQWPETNVWLPQHVKEKKREREREREWGERQRERESGRERDRETRECLHSHWPSQGPAQAELSTYQAE